MEKYIDLVLHPIRMRIIMALAGREMTAQQMGERLGDVPPATLYRHLSRLTKAGILEVTAENPVRGMLEKVYTLSQQNTQVDPQEFAAMSRDDHLRYFTTYMATLLDDFSRYVKNAEPMNVLTDGVGYQKFPLDLNEEEFVAVANGINAAFIPYLNNSPAPGRKRRLFAIIVMPDIETNKSQAEVTPSEGKSNQEEK
jgi:DNA-binding transcriptional ArsR family regulator